MKCQKCSDPLTIKDEIICSHCDKAFHYFCIGLQEKIFKAMKADGRSSIKCTSCREKPQPSQKVAAKTSAKDIGNSSSSRASTPQLESPQPASMVNFDFDRLITHIDGKLNSFKTDIMDSLFTRINDTITYELQQFKKEISSSLGKMEILQTSMDQLKQHQERGTATITALQSENENLRHTTAELKQRLDAIDQRSRNCNIEIQEVPENKNENIVSMVTSLCSRVSIPLCRDNITMCHRVSQLNPTSARPRNIVVTLSNPRIRDEIIAATRKYNKSNAMDKLNSKHLGINGETKAVYVCENLSRDMKKLYTATRISAKNKDYRYTWIRNGKIFTRKNDTSPVINISNFEKLNTL